MIPVPKTLLSAAWVATMEEGAAVLRDAGVVHEAGRIVAVGDAKALRREHPDATEIALGDVVLLPGLVNAHCHLELTSATRPAAPIEFKDWVIRLIGSLRQADASERASLGLRMGLAQCARFGVTSVGDITARPVDVRKLIVSYRDRRPSIVSYGEVRAMAARRAQLVQQLAAATELDMSPWIRVGVSPHSPYSIEPEGFRRCLADAKRARSPLTTHLAETPHESEFLAAHRGPLRDLWDAIGGWDDGVPRFEGGPIRYAKHLGLLDYAMTSLAHVNYCDDDDLELLAKGVASVVYCPRTHRYFGHPPHRWREMLGRGINVAVGTDSCASSPDLNLVDDLRLLHEIAPEIPVETIWAMATRRAARALGTDGLEGTLAVGKLAHFAAFDARQDHPLKEVLEDPQRLPLSADQLLKQTRQGARRD